MVQKLNVRMFRYIIRLAFKKKGGAGDSQHPPNKTLPNCRKQNSPILWLHVVCQNNLKLYNFSMKDFLIKTQKEKQSLLRHCFKRDWFVSKVILLLYLDTELRLVQQKTNPPTHSHDLLYLRFLCIGYYKRPFI